MSNQMMQNSMSAFEFFAKHIGPEEMVLTGILAKKTIGEPIELVLMHGILKIFDLLENQFQFKLMIKNQDYTGNGNLGFFFPFEGIDFYTDSSNIIWYSKAEKCFYIFNVSNDNYYQTYYDAFMQKLKLSIFSSLYKRPCDFFLSPEAETLASPLKLINVYNHDINDSLERILIEYYHIVPPPKPIQIKKQICLEPTYISTKPFTYSFNKEIFGSEGYLGSFSPCQGKYISLGDKFRISIYELNKNNLYVY